jgi:hypothetical protein
MQYRTQSSPHETWILFSIWLQVTSNSRYACRMVCHGNSYESENSAYITVYISANTDKAALRNLKILFEKSALIETKNSLNNISFL